MIYLARILNWSQPIVSINWWHLIFLYQFIEVCWDTTGIELGVVAFIKLSRQIINKLASWPKRINYRFYHDCTT